MKSYYSDVLSAERLRACYEAAPPRTRRYLEAELRAALSKLRPGQVVLEMGCGYGRLLEPLAAAGCAAAGIDTSMGSLALARELLASHSGVRLALMNAVSTGFADSVFDGTLCLQNGISAFHVDPRALFREAVRITRPGGRVIFSSYAGRFWPHRLAWFEAQAARGLIGPIDHEATKEGVIVCKDGFHATTVDAEGFRGLAESAGQIPEIYEVDGSSLFCEFAVRKGRS